MIELSPLARPYAKAVFSAALDAGNHEEVAKDLALLSLVSLTPQVTCLIEDPELSKEKIAQTIIGSRWRDSRFIKQIVRTSRG